MKKNSDFILENRARDNSTGQSKKKEKGPPDHPQLIKLDVYASQTIKFVRFTFVSSFISCVSEGGKLDFHDCSGRPIKLLKNCKNKFLIVI
jgi:hypothetical protein